LFGVSNDPASAVHHSREAALALHRIRETGTPFGES